MSSFHRPDWLSLAQAIASILAIAGAYGVVILQHRMEQKRRREEGRDRARQYLALARDFVTDATRAVNDTFEFRSDPANTETNPDRIEARSRVSQCLEALMSLQIEQVPTAAAVKQLILARSQLAYAMNQINVNEYGPGGERRCGKDYGKPLLLIVDGLQDAAKKLGEELTKLAG